MEFPTESFQVCVPLSSELVDIIELWKSKITAEYGCEWKSGENDMNWVVVEKFDKLPEDELILWQNAYKIIPKISVRLSGIHRMNTPVGTDWWISFGYNNVEWETMFELVNGLNNSDLKWMPRLKIPIGSTDSEFMNKTSSILRCSDELPWQNKEWTMTNIVIPENTSENEVIFHTNELSGELGVNTYQTLRNLFFQYGVVPNTQVKTQSSYSVNGFSRKMPNQHKPQQRSYQRNFQPKVQQERKMIQEDYPPLPGGEGGIIQRRSRPSQWVTTSN